MKILTTLVLVCSFAAIAQVPVEVEPEPLPPPTPVIRVTPEDEGLPESYEFYKEALWSEVPQWQVYVGGGISQPQGDYKDVGASGLNVQAGLIHYFSPSFGLGLEVNHAYNAFSFDVPIGFETAFAEDRSNYSRTSIQFLPRLGITENRLQLELVAGGGISFGSADNAEVRYTPDDAVVYSRTGSDETLFSWQAGISATYYWRRGVSFYFYPHYSSLGGDAIQYETRDLEGIQDDGSFPSGSNANDLPLENRSLGFDNVQFNLGVRFMLGDTFTADIPILEEDYEDTPDTPEEFRK